MLKITHNAGFFSCCNIRLQHTIKYFNTNKVLPTSIDSSEQFRMYKPHALKNTDITGDFFIYDPNSPIEYTGDIEISPDTREDQFSDYRVLNFKSISPFIHKYFSPSEDILSIKKELLSKYNIIPEKCIGLYYRGTDKIRETQIGDFDTFYDKLASLQTPGTQIIVQTDSFDFLQYITNKVPDAIIIHENSVSKTQRGIHNEKSSEENYRDIKTLFATFLLLSECNHLIVSSSNCSLWMMYVRGTPLNVHQCLNNIFI